MRFCMDFQEVESNLLSLNNESLISYNDLNTFYTSTYSFYLKNNTLLIKYSYGLFSLDFTKSFDFYLQEEYDEDKNTIFNINITSENKFYQHFQVENKTITLNKSQIISLTDLIMLILKHLAIKRLIHHTNI